jgi:predicted transposase
MKLTSIVKLQPSAEQRQLLYDTMMTANAACNAISDAAWDSKTFGTFHLHHLTYKMARDVYKLSAQVAVRCVAKVADAYKVGKSIKRQFKKLGAMAYDNRILNYRLQAASVSIWLLGGRQVMPFVCGAHQAELLAHQKGESDLVWHKGEFYLYATCDLPDGEAIDSQGWLGVDLGIVNIAVDSDGDVCKANHINNVRHRHRRLRQKLQRKGTKSAKRRLKALSGQEARFARDTNH